MIRRQSNFQEKMKALYIDMVIIYVKGLREKKNIKVRQIYACFFLLCFLLLYSLI